MSEARSEIEALRELWPSSERLSDQEIEALAAAIREKHREIHTATKAETRGGLMAAVLMGIVTVLVSWRARWMWAQIGYALCALGYITAVVVLWTYRRRERNGPELGMETRGYYDQLIAFHDRQIRFLKTAKYWYVLPVLAGVALIGWSLWVQTGNKLTSLLVGIVIPLATWFGVYYLNDVRRVGDLRAGREQLRKWISDVGLD
jgi:hypothetical protein